MSLDTTKIKQVPLKETEYFKEEYVKKQIVIHHTAGNASAVNVMNDWNKDTRGRIATCVSISGPGAKNSYDGEIVQGFSSRFWAYHLGIKGDVFKAYKVPHQILDKINIGIEVCNWGALDYENGKFLTYVDSIVKESDVVELTEPFKGKKYFHKYSDAQIESVKNLITYWSEIYNIPLTYDYNRLFTVNTQALKGEKGVFTHNSYRKDKIDIYPCPRMIEMLKSL
jgi:hypothetical protein